MYLGGIYVKIKFSIVLSIIITILLGTVVYADDINVQRLYGTDRYTTSISISQKGWLQSEYAILATGEDYVDALSSGPLAKKYSCPILLTSKSLLSDDLIAELKRLKVKNIFIVGGRGVISNSVESQLISMNIMIIRLAGVDRYETATKIAGRVGGVGELAVITGEDFSDALSIASIAAYKNMPILLNPPESLDNNVSNYINSKFVYKTYIVGNTSSISNNVMDELSKYDPERIDGVDKYDRNLKVINRFSDVNFNTVFLATGEDYPDSLSGVSLAAKTNSPIILINKSNIVEVKAFLKNKSIKNIMVLGGEGAISDNLVQGIINTYRSVEVNNTKELLKNIASNTTILLKSGEYHLGELQDIENNNIKYNKVYDGFEIILDNLKNFTIKADEGAYVQFLIEPRYAYVLSFTNCSNIKISGITAGHYPDKGDCTGGILKFTDCNDVNITNSILSGCGTEGLTLKNINNFKFDECTIRNCSYGIMTVQDSLNVNFNNSVFQDNKKFNLINVSSSDLNFESCLMDNNKTESTWVGDMYVFNIDKYSRIAISNSTIKNNYVKNFSNESIKLYNVKFTENEFGDNLGL